MHPISSMDIKGMSVLSVFRSFAYVAALSLLPQAAFPGGLDDASTIPHLDAAGRQGYRDFLEFNAHRAFAIAPGGAWSWKGGEATAEAASAAALQACQAEAGFHCTLYAVDDEIVFDAQAWAHLWGPYLDRTAAAHAGTGQNRGERFYDLSFRTAGGKTMRLSELQGKVIVLHFWGSWCPSCRGEMPDMQALHRALGASKDIQMVLLQVRENFDTAQRWMRQQQMDLPLFDSRVSQKAPDALLLADGRTIRDRDVAPVFPTTFILDKHGIIVFSHTGSIAHWPQYLPLLQDVAARSGR